MATANEKLFNSLVKHQTYLLRYSASLRNMILSELKPSNQNIKDIAAASLGGMTSIESGTDWRRVERTIERVQRERALAWSKAQAKLASELKQLSRRERDFTITQLQKSLPVQVDLKKPTLAAVDARTRRPVAGRTATQWGTKLKNDDLNRIRSSIIASVSNGTPIKQGLTAAYKTNEHGVNSITRTLVNHTATESRLETFKENDIIEQEEYISVLDDRTTLICAGYDGKIFAKGRGPKPPLHIGCRSIRVAVYSDAMLKDMPLLPQTERELVADYAKENNLGDITSRADLPFGHKGKFDEYAPQRVAGLIGGPVERISYNDWLKRQDKDYIVDTLGPSRAAMFDRGDLTLDKFVNRSGDALTLDEISMRYPDAFRGKP